MVSDKHVGYPRPIPDKKVQENLRSVQ